jgi:hypothetical protein
MLTRKLLNRCLQGSYWIDNDLQNSTHKAKYWTTQIPLNNGCDNSRVILLTILVIKHEWWKNSIVIRTVKCWWPQLSHQGSYWIDAYKEVTESMFTRKLLNRCLQGSYIIDAYKEATESMLTRKLHNRCLQGSYRIDAYKEATEPMFM